MIDDGVKRVMARSLVRAQLRRIVRTFRPVPTPEFDAKEHEALAELPQWDRSQTIVLCQWCGCPCWCWASPDEPVTCTVCRVAGAPPKGGSR